MAAFPGLYPTRPAVWLVESVSWTPTQRGAGAGIKAEIQSRGREHGPGAGILQGA